MNNCFWPEQFTQHWGVTWILDIRIKVVSQKIEKGGQMGKTNPFCLGFSALGELRHKIQNVICRNLVELFVYEILVKL